MKYLVVPAIFSLLFTSCASTYQYTKIGNSNTNDKDMATIYVLRPGLMGSALKFKIYQSDQLIGKLGPKSYLVWNVQPKGKELRIISKSENKDMVAINPQPGKTYYVKQKIRMGIAIARTELVFIDENEGKDILLKLRAPTSKYAE